nr:arylesterase [Corticibacter populi]
MHRSNRVNSVFHRRHFIASSLSGFLLGSWAGLAAAQPSAQPAPAPPPPRLLVLGDSISAEYGLARGQGWVTLLTQQLQEAARPVQVINASISGETTAGGRTRLPALLRQHSPAYVIIELGGNDALRGLALESTRANLNAMVDAAQAAGARVLLLGIQVPPNYGQRYTQEFATLFETVAQQKNTGLVPFMLEAVSAPEDLDRYFQADRIHPNAQAQPLLLETVWPAIEALLQHA